MQRRRSTNFGDFQDHCFFENAASGSELQHAAQNLSSNGSATGVSIIGGG